jgi:transcription elongation GreA/GreB family factor
LKFSITEVKEKLLAACRHYANDRIAVAREAMQNAQQSANEEGKNSAGDKYETGRAMMQIERDQAAVMLEEAQKLLPMLERIKADAVHDSVIMGSVVGSKQGNFFIGISAGTITVENTTFITIAPTSPIAQQLLGKVVGDQFNFKGQLQTIEWVG